MGVALANGGDEITVPLLGAPRELSGQGGLATASLAGHEADLALAAEGTVEELP